MYIAQIAFFPPFFWGGGAVDVVVGREGWTRVEKILCRHRQRY